MEVKIMLNEREKHKMETIIKIVKKEITIKDDNTVKHNLNKYII